MHNCCICLLDITDTITKPESCNICKQFYHNECICNWINENNSCPHCRSTMWGNMLLNSNTIIYYFTKIKTSNRICFANSENIIDERDDLPHLLTIIQIPNEDLVRDMKNIIQKIREYKLEALFRRMLTVPTYDKLECDQELKLMLPIEKTENYDICLLHIYIFYRGGYQDTITEILINM